MNLLSNAIKFSPEGGQIDLTVEEQVEAVRVLVADQGPGIPPDQQPNLFRRFVHIDAADGRAEYGAGLGLSVVKAIIETQGGRVGVMDRPGGGAIFWFTLPRAAEAVNPGNLPR
jgi:signal transduction histidine kinase